MKAAIFASSATLIIAAICMLFSPFLSGALIAQSTSGSSATSSDDIRSKIDARNKDIQQITAEIQQYSDLVDKTSNEAHTLQNSIRLLEQNANLLGANIKKTNDKISVAGLDIEKINGNIDTSVKKIGDLQHAIAESLRYMDMHDDSSLMAIILSQKSLSGALSAIDFQVSFNERLQKEIDSIDQEKNDLETSKTAEQSEKDTLVALQAELADKKKAVDETTQEKNSLLADTKGKEANFQKIVNDKLATRDSFEQEVFNYESKLSYDGKKSSLPPSVHGTLFWPVDNVRITQLFGKTVGANRLYASGSHNGVDFGASIGTAVKAALSGTVVGTGDTDVTCPKASFGRWVFIHHDNGLASIYAHLSVISVKQGQRVATGDLLGYSGNTGYTTGPHLHVSVYEGDQVSVQNRPSAVCIGKTYTMPIAPIEAYLDPMIYFPAYGAVSGNSTD